MEHAPILKDGRFPPIDLWIFVATRLIERINRGGIIQRNRDGFFAGGESGINAVYCGDVSDRYFNDLLPALKSEADKDTQYDDLKQWLKAEPVCPSENISRNLPIGGLHSMSKQKPKA